MRASKVGLIGLAGGAALYALRRTGIGGRTSGTGTSSSRSQPRANQHRVSTASQAGRTSQVWPDVAAEFDVDAERLLAERDEQADRPVDDTADSSGLVAAERDALTVPGEDGEDHRRRDQTAGEAAREIAAAQVRARRSGGGETEEDYS